MQEWQKKYNLVFTKYFDEVMYWGYLSYYPVGKDHFWIQVFYPMVSHYLGMLHKIGYTKIIKPCGFTPTTASKNSNAINEMECPLEIEIPFVVGKFELNCEKFSFKAGEGVVFGFEKNLKTQPQCRFTHLFNYFGRYHLLIKRVINVSFSAVFQPFCQ